MNMNIKRIEKLHPDWYSKDSSLSYDDQLWIWENVPLPKEDIEKIKQIEASEESVSVNVNGNANGTGKRHLNYTQNISKSVAIDKLKQCHYRTAPKKIASYLEIILHNKNTKPGHWLYIAQRYTPKTINSVLNEMMRSAKRGDVSFKVPAAYFTSIIKLRLPRKKFRKEKKFAEPKF